MNHLKCFFQPLRTAIVVFLAFQCAACVPPPNIEDDGGFRVTYALRSVKPGDQQAAVVALQQRLDDVELRGSKVAERGADQIEITLPGIDPEMFEHLQKLLVTPGKLEFRILAREGTHDTLIAAATAAKAPPDDRPKSDQPSDDEADDATSPQTKWVRFDAKSLELPAGAVQRSVDGQSETLVVLDANNVDDRLLETISGVADSSARPSIAGRLTTEGGTRMRRLTADNAPVGNVYQSLGVVLDDRLILAPRVVEPFGEAFMLTGNFTQQEVDFLVAVLRVGRLSVEIEPEPVKIEAVTGKRQE